MHYWNGNKPDSGILMKHNDDDYSQGCSQIKEVFRALTKDDIVQPYISDNDFRSSNEDDDVGYNLYIFVIRYQKNIEPAQPIKVEIKFSENIPAGIYVCVNSNEKLSEYKRRWPTPFWFDLWDI